MAQKIRHRGPDWSGIYVGGSAILAHERLSIVDPQSGGQPLYSPDRKQILAVNGEIYNHRDIRAHYAGKYTFQTGSDCEVILALYKDKGINFLEELNGIFAFALYDEETDDYLIARDPRNNTKANDEPAKALIAELEKAAAAGCEKSAEILKSKQYIAKKSVWIFGGDGWAYDIGFGGLDHVLASGEDVNVMVFDTEMYSNTGGQASKASNIGEVCQFAAAGKEISKKSLSEIAMTYGYIYVAQIALGANPAQAVKAIAEAEAYPGPSLIIGYAPCELHGVKGGMTNCQNEMKKAVEAGYWNLFTFNPANKAQGKNPFTLTSKAVDNEKYQALLANETRYSRLTRAFPDRAKELFARNQEVANDRYEHLTRLVDLYK